MDSRKMSTSHYLVFHTDTDSAAQTIWVDTERWHPSTTETPCERTSTGILDQPLHDTPGTTPAIQPKGSLTFEKKTAKVDILPLATERVIPPVDANDTEP